jgi:hypothetical protein
VRPSLEYNTTVWSPCTIQLHVDDLLKNVQRNFSKRIPSLSLYPYGERLAILNLDILELGRLRFDLMFYYKVLNHLTLINSNSVFTMNTPPFCLRANLPFLQRPGNSSSRILHVFYFFTEAFLLGIYCLQTYDHHPLFSPLNVILEQQI